MSKREEEILNFGEDGLPSMIKALVEDGGDEMAMRTSTCTVHKAAFPSCDGCRSELGCCKFSLVSAIFAICMKIDEKNGELDKISDTSKKLTVYASKIVYLARSVKEVKEIYKEAFDNVLDLAFREIFPDKEV